MYPTYVCKQYKPHSVYNIAQCMSRAFHAVSRALAECSTVEAVCSKGGGTVSFQIVFRDDGGGGGGGGGFLLCMA